MTRDPSAAPCFSRRSTRSRTRSSGRTTAPATTRAGTASAPIRFPCPAPGCTFVAEYMTAAHLVLVWEERDDPNLLWHAQRAKEVGRNPRVVPYERSFGPSASYYAWEAPAGRSTACAARSEDTCSMTPGERATARAALYVIASRWSGVRRRSSGALLAAAGSRSARPSSSASSPGRRSRRIAASRRPSSASLPPRARCGRCGSASPSAPGEAIPRSTRRCAPGSRLGLAGPTPLVLFRESTVAGRFVWLAAVEGLAPYVVLAGGRLPRRCTPARCEVRPPARAGRAPERAGAPARPGRHGHAPLEPALRRLPRADRQRARRPRGRAGPAAGAGLPPSRRPRRSSSPRASRR